MRSQVICFFYFFVFFPIKLLAAQQQLHLNKTWLNLGHYQEAFGTDRYLSESRPSHFFLSPDGHKSPEAELKATIKAFRDQESKEYCHFPARLQFLKKELPDTFGQYSLSDCSKFQSFKNKLAAKSLALIFSSYHLDSPASTFGHTLLRFMKRPSSASADYELLDYATNYAASVTTQNPLLYGFLGITGGFRGEFTSMPFFYKVREYNDYESRDLWSYHLNIQDDELQMIIAHLWELKRAYFPYYYFTKNCSYYMLTLLDVANPKWNFARKIGYLSVPVETIKIVNEVPGLVERTSFRPSKQRLLSKRLDDLNNKEIRQIKQTLKDYQIERLISDDQDKSAKLLDAAIDGLDHLHAKKILLEETSIMKQKRKFLIARSRLKSDSQNEIPIPAPSKENPTLSHGTKRLSHYYGDSQNKGAFSSLELRLTLHDFLDPIAGYPKATTMEMGRLKLNYFHKEEENKRLRLQEFTLVNVEALNTDNRFFSKYSWNLYIGAKRLRDDDGANRLAPQFKGSIGKSTKLSRLYLTAYLQAALEHQKDLSSTGLRARLGPRLQILGHLPKDFNFLVFSQLDYFPKRSIENAHFYWGAKLRKQILKNIGLSLSFQDYETGPIAEIGLNFYY